MTSKLERLKKIRESLSISIDGQDNIPIQSTCLFVSNHNCLMDVFYLPMVTSVPMIDMISSRLIYKRITDRQKMINNYLYAMPIEAHGGKVYSDMCLECGIKFLATGTSVGIFPEGAYLPGREIYRGRTGASRILYGAKSLGVDVYLIPVAIDVLGDFNLDSYSFDDREVSIKILPSVMYDNDFDMFMSTDNYSLQNKALHNPIDKSMRMIAGALDRPYVDEYIELYPKGNVIFSNGKTVSTDVANGDAYVSEYQMELDNRVRGIKKHILKNEYCFKR